MSLLRQDYSCLHQLIICEIVLETKLSTLRSICLNDRFSRHRQRFASLAFDRKTLLGIRHQDIYSHSVDCTRVPWESLTSMLISLALVNGSHHWPVIKWFLPCSTWDHCHDVDRIVLCGRWGKDPSCLLESTHIFLSRLWWSILYEVPTWIQICMVMVVLKFVFIWHRSTVYVW